MFGCSYINQESNVNNFHTLLGVINRYEARKKQLVFNSNNPNQDYQVIAELGGCTILKNVAPGLIMI